ncbi:MAG TPA: ABC transporter permease subunit [Vicinamibacterales bacterium]|nr:ABC transporter permease subunit [Vicinamibacterales bacterium]
MSTAGGITAEPPVQAAPPPAGASDRGRYLVGAVFLAPALLMLGVWMVYPLVYTVIRSFFGQTGFIGTWVGIDNYKSLFVPFNLSNPLLTAIKNNLIWVAVVPALVTAIGLIFAVLTERVRWSVAFKTVVFLPMAISAFATGVTWRIMYQQDPNLGAVNALSRSVSDVFHAPGVLQNALPSTPTLVTKQGTLVLKTPLQPGRSIALGLTGIPPEQVPGGAKQAVQPKAKSGAIDGVVWRDFKPGGGKPGVVEQGELGIPGVTVQLRDASGKTYTAHSASDGTFSFDKLASNTTYTASIGQATFRKPFGGFSWLGPKLITPSLIIAYIWIWAGFAMVVIAAGLSAMPRDVLEAARTDGATEWQTFRRVTVPLLLPVLSVVFITMIINVLKVFDLVFALAPQSTQADANVIALAMWRVSFGGQNDFGTGSAIAVLLFLLVIPVLALNIKRFRSEG